MLGRALAGSHSHTVIYSFRDKKCGDCKKSPGHYSTRGEFNDVTSFYELFFAYDDVSKVGSCDSPW